MVKHLLKLAGSLIIIIIIGFGIHISILYLQEKTDSKKPEKKHAEKLDEEFEDDLYGGVTPDETLRLLTNALKKGDTELAAKYFTANIQNQWREDLATLKDKNFLSEMISDLKNYKTEKIEVLTALYSIPGHAGAFSPLIFIKSKNGRWKIQTL